MLLQTLWLATLLILPLFATRFCFQIRGKLKAILVVLCRSFSFLRLWCLLLTRLTIPIVIGRVNNYTHTFLENLSERQNGEQCDESKRRIRRFLMVSLLAVARLSQAFVWSTCGVSSALRLPLKQPTESDRTAFRFLQRPRVPLRLPPR